MAQKETSEPPADFLDRKYLQRIDKRWVYGGLAVFALIAIGLLIFTPRYKSLTYADKDQMEQAHHDLIMAYFVKSTTCEGSELGRQEQIRIFNEYFKVNQYANRAVMRGCDNVDTLYARGDTGKWKPLFELKLDAGQHPSLQRSCLIADITKTDKNAKLDTKKLALCDKLRKERILD